MHVIFCIIQLVNVANSSPCQAATFIATNDWKTLSSPYFPDTIHAKTRDAFHYYRNWVMATIVKINSQPYGASF